METKLATLISKSKQIYSTFKFNDHSEGLSDFSQSCQKKNIVYASSFDSTISVYDIDATKSLSVLSGHTKGVWSCSANPHLNQLVTGGNDNKIILWDCKQNTPIHQIEKHSEVIYDVQYSSNGKYFGSCSKGLICIWDTLKLDKPIKVLNYDLHGQRNFIYCLNFLDNDNKIITGFIDGTIIISEINSDKLNKYTLPNMKAEFYKEAQGDYSNSIYSLTKFKSSDKIIVSHSDGSVRIFNTINNKFELIDTFSCNIYYLFISI